MSAIERVREFLKTHPDVKFSEGMRDGGSFISVSPPNPEDGFEVSVWDNGGECIVKLGTHWHQHFLSSEDREEEAATRLFILALSEDGRLRIAIKRAAEVGFAFQIWKSGKWVSFQTQGYGAFAYPFWRKPEFAYKQNRWLGPKELGSDPK